MRRKTKRRWVRNLETVMLAYEKEKRERPEGVPPITKYFRRVGGERSSGDGVRMAGNPSRSPNEAAYPMGDAVS